MWPLRAHLTVKPPGREAAVADRRSVCLAEATGRRPSPARFSFDETRFVGADVDLSWRLRRQGRFVVIREPVVTSVRMVRIHGAFEALGLLAGLLRPGSDRRRSGRWHRKRRDDPGAIDS
jgi:hypothetical protein